MARLLIAEASRFPALTDRYQEEIQRPCMDLLKKTIQRGVDRGEIRELAVTECPLVIIAPIALVDTWMMMFGDRHPLDLKRISTLTSSSCSTVCWRSQRRLIFELE